MVDTLAEELLEQAKLLLTLPSNQANLRRAVSAAYYSLFHLLIRSTVSKWSDPLHQARIGRIFEHERMRRISAATVKSLEAKTGAGASTSLAESTLLSELKAVAQSFIVLQQARVDADYNLEHSLEPDYASGQVARANAAFESWKIAGDSEAAREYMFSLLFKEKERA
jgi:hypothetical protein